MFDAISSPLGVFDQHFGGEGQRPRFTVTGTPEVGETLSADPAVSNVVWLRGGNPISGGTGSDYTTVQADDDKLIGYSGLDTEGQPITSNSVRIIQPANPVFTTQPDFDEASYFSGDLLTFNEGVAGPGATLALELFEFEGEDVSDELSGLTWQSPDGETGTVSLRIRATNSRGSTLSDVVTVPIVEIPAPVLDTPVDLPDLVTGQAFSYDVSQHVSGATGYTMALGSPALPAGVTLSAAGLLSAPSGVASPINVTLVMKATNDGPNALLFMVDLEVTAAPVAINPTFGNLPAANTPGAGGNPDSIGGFILNYTGSDPLDIYVANGASAGFPITKAQLEAGAGGGGVEFANVLGFSGGPFALTGFTDDSVVEQAIFIKERNNGGQSPIYRVALSDIDFQRQTFASATTDAAGTNIAVQLSDDLWGATSPADWVVNVGGAPVVVSSATPDQGTDIVNLAVPAIAHGAVVTISYSGTGLTDERGLAMLAFTEQPVTNAVPAGVTDDFDRTDTGSLGSGPEWTVLDLRNSGIEIGIDDNEAEIVGSGSWNWIFYEHEDVLPDDQKVSALVMPTGFGDAFNTWSVICRITATGFYQARLAHEDGVFTLRLYRFQMSGDVQTALVGITAVGSPTLPSRLEIEAEGSTIRARFNGVEVSATDATYASGKGGIGLQARNSVDTHGLDDYISGAMAA